MPKFAMLLPVLALTLSSPVAAEPVKVTSAASVDQAVVRITQSVEAAGNRAFAVVDFSQGSKSVGNDLRPTTLVIFGSPKIGGDALLTGQKLGLYLPLRVLAYEDESGDVWLMYESPDDAAQTHGIAQNHPAIKRMQSALDAITAKASTAS